MKKLLKEVYFFNILFNIVFLFLTGLGLIFIISDFKASTLKELIVTIICIVFQLLSLFFLFKKYDVSLKLVSIIYAISAFLNFVDFRIYWSNYENSLESKTYVWCIVFFTLIYFIFILVNLNYKKTDDTPEIDEIGKP